MDSIVHNCDQDQFANGQSSRDLRVSPDPTEPRIQFIETIDSSGDFFLASSTVQRER